MALLIDNDVTDRVLDSEASFEAIEDALRQLGEGRATFNPRVDIWSPTAEAGDAHDLAVLLGAVEDPPRAAIRFRSDVMVWEERDGVTVGEKFNGQPGTFMGFVILFDTTDGEIIGLLNDGIVQHARVGANAGVGAKYLAREDASTVGMVGSGGMARSYARAFAVCRDLESMRVYSPTVDHREAYAEEMADELGIEVTPVESTEAAVDGVDIVSLCTNAEETIYDPDWLEPGQLVISNKTSEVGDDTYEAVDSLYCNADENYTQRTFSDAREGLKRQNRSYERSFDFPTVPEVIVGDAPGRTSDTETIHYRNNSSGIQFAAVGSVVHERAVERGLGTEVPVSWFQQDIKD